MANLQVEKGHLNIANEFVEGLEKTYFNTRECMVLWASELPIKTGLDVMLD